MGSASLSLCVAIYVADCKEAAPDGVFAFSFSRRACRVLGRKHFRLLVLYSSFLAAGWASFVAQHLLVIPKGRFFHLVDTATRRGSLFRLAFLLVVGALSREELCPPAGITASFELPAGVTRVPRVQFAHIPAGELM